MAKIREMHDKNATKAQVPLMEYALYNSYLLK
jgi:hypothetical protein